MQAIKNFFRSFSSSTDSRTIDWMNDLNNLGFDKVAFPILIKDGTDLNLVYFDEFASDPDLHYREFESNYELIDSNGQLWTWKYDHTNETNLPGTFIRTMTLDEVKKIIDTYFSDRKVKTEIEKLSSEAKTIFDLFEKLETKF